MGTSLAKLKLTRAVAIQNLANMIAHRNTVKPLTSNVTGLEAGRDSRFNLFNLNRKFRGQCSPK